MKETERLYLDLMKKCLTNSIYGAAEVCPYDPRKNPVKRALVGSFYRQGLRVVRSRPMDPARREDGRDRSPVAHTMVGRKRLDNIEDCVGSVISEGVPGDLIETGVWRGGAAIFMRACLKAFGSADRVVWAADSFEGLPRPEEGRYPEDKGDTLHASRELVVPLEDVKANFSKYGLLDDQVRFLKGWFKDTLPGAPIEKLAIMRLDGDMYGSTMDALASLYPKLSPGGYTIIDDYGAMDTCRKAVEDFRAAWGIKEPIERIDWTGAYWKRAA